MTRTWTFDAPSEAAVDRLGELLAAALPERAVVALIGTLGAGKTRLVRAVAQAVGIDPRTVVSPTFVLVQQYHGERSLTHLDVYRLKDLDEFEALGPEEYFESPGWTFIEWADRVAESLPLEVLRIEIEVTGLTSRRFVVSSASEYYAECLERLDQARSD
ncbi:MAG: tRNA (adenosine(37)-N6)-threonylcarbamoyltransferase complex ATPase subunit type 1 TsaE [Pirellulales bacterium]